MRQEFPDDCVDLIVTSPPYDDLRCYGGFDFDFEAIGRQMLRVLTPGGVAVWIVGERVKDGRTCSSFVLSKGAPTTFNPLTCATKQTGVRMTVYGRDADGDNSKRRTCAVQRA